MKKILFLVLAAFFVINPSFADSSVFGLAMNKAKKTACELSLRDIGIALSIYASENESWYPEPDNIKGLDELRVKLNCDGAKHPDNAQYYKEKQKNPELGSDYVYMGGWGNNMKDTQIIPVVFDKVGNGHLNVLFADGHIENIPLQKPFKSCLDVIEILNQRLGYKKELLDFLRERAIELDQNLGYINENS